MRNVSLASLFCGCMIWTSALAANSDLKVIIRPVGVDEASADALTKVVLSDSKIQERLAGSRYRLLRSDFESIEQDKDQEAPLVSTADWTPSAYRLEIYNYTKNHLLTVEGSFNDSTIDVRESLDQPAPTPEEYQDAIEYLRNDPYFGGVERIGKWSPYEAMPPIIEIEPEGASTIQERVISVGVMPKEPGMRHEIVGVNLNTGEVIRFPSGAPPKALATEVACALPNAGQGVTRRGTPGKAEITVEKAGQELWKFTVVRPSASSGRWGSAIDLRNIAYRGRKVLSQAHLPILNVQYAQNACGPYRDWIYSENPFQAEGSALASGILSASAPARTIFEAGTDRGNYRGVAVYTEGDETVLVSELSAGWYRYKSEFRFAEDGTLKPRWGFDAVQDSCTCREHFHHAYWRFDFDIGNKDANRIEVHDGSGWKQINQEVRQVRDSSHKKWRILDSESGAGYEIVPGHEDGSADHYGKGDFWALKYVRGQIDDSQVYTGTAANLDAFVTGQSLTAADVVVWYAGHYLHSQDGRHDPRIVGPELKPIGWSSGER